MPMDKVFVVGDSHAIALAEGAQLAGLTVGMAFLSGNDWHSGVVRFHRRLGLAATGRPGFQRKMRDGCANLGTESILAGDHIIVTSLGYQLGRLVSPMARAGHRFNSDLSVDTPLLVSRGFVEATVMTKRASQFDLVRKLTRRRRVIVVSPPVFGRSVSDDLVRDIIGEALERAGADVFDTRRLAPDDGVVPEKERHEDGIHGTADYGRRVMEAVLSRVSVNAEA